MLPLKVKSLLAASDKLQRSQSAARSGAALCAGLQGGGWHRSTGAGKGLEKYRFERWFCVTLLKEREGCVTNRRTSGFILFQHLLLLGFYQCAYSLKNMN